MLRRFLLALALVASPIATQAQQAGALQSRLNLADVANKPVALGILGGVTAAQAAAAAPVQSVAGRAGAVSLAHTDITDWASATAGFGSGSSGVTSFNTRTGVVSLLSADVTAALGFTPYSASNPSGFVSATGAAAAAPVQTVASRTGAVTLTHSDITDWASATAGFGSGSSGVTSFNTRTGVVSLLSADVTAALGFTPYNASNPSGYVSATGAAAAAPVQSVAGRAGVVTLSVSDVSGAGNVSNSGTPTSGQIARWTSSTAIQGVTASSVVSSGVTGLPVVTSVANTDSVAVVASGVPSTITVANLSSTVTSLPTGSALVGTELFAGRPVSSTTDDSYTSAQFAAYINSTIFSGAFTHTITLTGNTNVTSPTSGTLISSVTAPAANPVTGTPSSSTYLRGDGTWNTPSGGGGSSAPVPELLRNGTFLIGQQGLSGFTVTTGGSVSVSSTTSPTVSTSGYTLDGWMVQPSGASVTVAQVANSRSGAQSLYGMQITGATSNSGVTVSQRHWNEDAVRAAGQIVTVQAQIYNGTSASITPTLTVMHPTTANTFPALPSSTTGMTTDVSAVSLQSVSASSFGRVAYTFTAPAGFSNGDQITISFPAVGAGQTVIVTDADMQVTSSLSTGLQSSPPAPIIQSRTQIFSECMYTYWTTYTYGTALGTGSQPNGYIQLVSNFNPSLSGSSVSFPTRMHAAPTVSTYSISTGAKGNFTYYASGYADYPTATYLTLLASDWNLVWTYSASGTAAVYFHATFDARP